MGTKIKAEKTFEEIFLESRGVESLEAYVDWSNDGNIDLRLKGSVFYKQLFELGIISEVSSFVRTHYTHGEMDGCYAVREDGLLQGLDTAHSSLDGIFHPDNILSLEKAPDAYSIEDLVPKDCRLPRIVDWEGMKKQHSKLI